jgi:hypothetical protein
VILTKGEFDIAQLALGLSLSEQPREHRDRLTVTALGDKVPRAFGDEQQGQQEQQGRDRLHPKHPAPRRIAQPEIANRRTGCLGEIVVCKERSGQPADDHYLLHTGKPSSNGGRGDLADIGR